jgi:predicted GTPase
MSTYHRARLSVAQRGQVDPLQPLVGERQAIVGTCGQHAIAFTFRLDRRWFSIIDTGGLQDQSEIDQHHARSATHPSAELAIRRDVILFVVDGRPGEQR